MATPFACLSLLGPVAITQPRAAAITLDVCAFVGPLPTYLGNATAIEIPAAILNVTLSLSVLMAKTRRDTKTVGLDFNRCMPIALVNLLVAIPTIVLSALPLLHLDIPIANASLPIVIEY